MERIFRDLMTYAMRNPGCSWSVSDEELRHGPYADGGTRQVTITMTVGGRRLRSEFLYEPGRIGEISLLHRLAHGVSRVLAEADALLAGAAGNPGGGCTPTRVGG